MITTKLKQLSELVKWTENVYTNKNIIVKIDTAVVTKDWIIQSWSISRSYRCAEDISHITQLRSFDKIWPIQCAHGK